MNRYLTYGLLLLVLTGSCTNARWMVKDYHTVDSDDFEQLASRQFLNPAGTPTPEDPVLRIQLYSETTYEYAEKVLMARYIQDYKIRPFFFTLGLMGAGAAFYVANSNSIIGVQGRLESLTLNAIGGIIAAGSLLNFKPSGDPRATGEERFLRQTGTRVMKDTTQVTDTIEEGVTVNIQYGDRPVVKQQMMTVNEGHVEIDLGSALSALEIQERNPRAVHIQIQYADSSYSYTYPLQVILRPFARVETPVTELRNAAAESQDNVLAELVEGSQLQIVEEIGQHWVKVLYGISENYLSRSDVSLVWRTSDFAQKDRVVAVPTVPFGNIDVENNIPILVSANRNGFGLLIGNEEYSGNLDTRTFTERDLRLIRTYLTSALGYPPENVQTLENIAGRGAIDSVLTLFRTSTTGSSNLFVYLSGYGTVRRDGDDYMPYFLPSTGDADSGINLINLYNAIARLPSESTVIVNNIDFTHPMDDSASVESGTLPSSQQPLYNAATLIASQHENLAILFSSEIGQSSHVYLGNGEEDKKHHIFPYYFARALQERNTNIGEIFRYLQNNVSYTSRRLHDQPQDPLIFGNRSIELVEQN